MALPQAELKRTARHLSLPGFGIEQQERLHNAHVLMVGAGGLGCPALQSLAAAGIGTITIIDDDTVDLSNIHRQFLFGTTDIGQPKVEVAAARLRQLQPGITINTLQERLTVDNAIELIAAADIVLDGCDTFATAYLIADAAEITGTPLIWATVLRFHGDLALFHSSNTQRGVGLRDLFPTQPPANLVPDCATAGVLGSTTAVMGSLMATHTIGFLAGLNGITPGTLLSYDAFPANTRSFNISADPARAMVTRLAPHYGATQCTVKTDLLERVRSREFLALDIREKHEVLINDLPADIPTVKLPLSRISTAEQVNTAIGTHQKVLVYCASGVRSAKFIKDFQHLNAELFSLPGGVNALTT
ncbi:ThiF family adenylyltransferase [Corynebacterium callunae]|uniref:ThiF family adenylyltransferase n=1 Tax=Corynebacterium callunae TaxID=1721 RepID=UPI001FFE62EE|nr:ThiF family adenylyltransferase [Corynebacterium callunae]MCK2199527.1 ThiF family adenylyltransferase [Corynebacterium callunae]